MRLFNKNINLHFRSKSFGEAYFKSLLLWNPLICVGICLLLGNIHSLGSRLLNCLLIANLVTNFCFLSVALVRFLVRRFSKSKGANPLLRSRGWSLSVSMFAMPAGLYIAIKAMGILAPLLHLQGATTNADDYRQGLLIGTLIAGLYSLFETRAEAKDAAKEAELKYLQAQLAALTAQMNPHLLFNALNTIAALVPTNPKQAEAMIVKLSELYRGVLDASRQMTHSLETELGICDAYLAIEKARFGDRLESILEVAENINASSVQVPALSLQPLIENAVKHGIAPLAAGGKIRLFATAKDGALHIIIEDNGVGIEQASTQKTHGAGSGIKNCRDRLALHFGEEGIFSLQKKVNGGTLVSIVMPIIKKEAL